MSDEGKDFYKQLFEAEKAELVNAESCSVNDIHNNPGSNLGASSSVRLLKQMDNSVLSSVMKIDDLDQIVTELQCEKEKNMETVFNEKLQVSQLQYIVNEKSSEIKSFNDKYNTILLQHSACQDDSTSKVTNVVFLLCIVGFIFENWRLWRLFLFRVHNLSDNAGW